MVKYAVKHKARGEGNCEIPFFHTGYERSTMPKVSQYNLFSPWRDGYYLAYNAMSGALGLMTSENYETYKLLAKKISNGTPENYSEQEKELLMQLQHGKFIVDSGTSEFDSLKFKYRQSRFSTKALGLIIAPTMACNMACEYCFEANKQGKMSSRVVESIIDFIEKQAPDLDQVDISWYGGEPLLAFDIMEDITESVLELAKEYNFEYKCEGIITNGYLLDKEKTDWLAKMKTGQAQITIDGPSYIHDQKRPLKNGKKSFDTIIQNIQYACDKIPVVIRVNIDNTFTQEMIEELLHELTAAGLRNKVAFYFGQLEPATTTCANISDNCYESKAFSKTEIQFYKTLLDYGFYIQKLPHPIMTFCFAQLTNSFLVDHEGELYRCFNYAGDKDRSIGNIKDSVNLHHPEFNHLFAFDPFENESCRACNILPICMGSCPSRRGDRNIPEEEFCDSWKYNLEPMLELVALSRQQQVRQTAGQDEEEIAQ